MDGTDLASVVSTKTSYEWNKDDARNHNDAMSPAIVGDERPELHVVAYDFGIKHNILRMLNREKLPRHRGSSADFG